MGILKNIFDADTRVWNSEMSGYLEICVARLNASEGESYKKIGNAIIAFTYAFAKATAAPDVDKRYITAKFSNLPQGSASALARTLAGYAVGVLARLTARTDGELSSAFVRSFSYIMDLRACDVYFAQDLISADDPSFISAPSKVFELICEVLGRRKDIDLGARIQFELMLPSYTSHILIHSAFGEPK